MRYLIDPALPQWKGNFHTHTTESDGRATPQEAVSLYEQAGYDFLALTDHRKVTDPRNLSTSMVLIPGVELDYVVHAGHAQAVHIIGVGVRDGLMDIPGLMDSPQQGVDGILSQGGRAIFAHPAWSLNMPAVIEEMRGVSAVEIYNHVSDAPWNAQRGDSSSILDLCFADGCLLPVVAGDDSHHYNGDACHSALILSAPERTRESLLDALARGRVYASQGPRFREMFLDEAGDVHVKCTPVQRVIFSSNATYVKDRVFCGEGLTEITYHPKPHETYLRVEITDEEGLRAWSSPVGLVHQG